MKKNNKKLSIGDEIIESLNNAIQHEKGIKVKGVKSKTITISPIPHLRSNQIRDIRNKLGLTQVSFAYILGVSVKTVEAWESGRNEPKGPAQRLLFILGNDSGFLKKYKLVSNL